MNRWENSAIRPWQKYKTSLPLQALRRLNLQIGLNPRLLDKLWLNLRPNPSEEVFPRSIKILDRYIYQCKKKRSYFNGKLKFYIKKWKNNQILHYKIRIHSFWTKDTRGSRSMSEHKKLSDRGRRCYKRNDYSKISWYRKSKRESTNNIWKIYLRKKL